MKRNLLAIVLVGAMAVSLAACGGSGAPIENTPADSAATTDGGISSSDSLHLVNGKIEVDAPLKALAAAYEAETGVHVEIESIGGGVDIQGQLKQYFQGNNMPDIFVNGGATDFANWEGLLADMSNEAWVEDTEAEYVDVDGKVVGFPYTTEAIGLAYNADILEKAGIDPASITGPESMKATFETLDSKKDELGLTAVIGYCAEAMNLYWSTGDHLFDVYEDEGLERDDTTYFDLLSDGGKIDKERFVKYAEMVGLFNQYSDPSLLVSGTYDQQILNFASGKYAFVTQGSWIGVTMTTNDKEQYEAAGSFKVGMLPYAFEEGQDTILTNSPSWWAVYDGDKADAAKAFLQWCSEDAGQKILVEDAGFISPFKSCKYTSVDPFAQTITDYMQAGKTSAWHFLGNKEGLAQNALGVVYQDYASGNIKDAETFTDIVSQATAQYYAS